MGLESFTELDILQGFLNGLFVLGAGFLGLRIILKYKSFKRKEFLVLGLTAILLSSPWWGSSISFAMIILFDYRLDVFWDLFLGMFFVPFALIGWIYFFSLLTYPDFKKKLVFFYSVIAISYDIGFVILLSIDTDIIAIKYGLFHTRASPYALIFQLFVLLTTIITGILFARHAMKSEDPKIRLKGKFLVIGFLMFTICAGFEAIFPLNVISLILIRSSGVIAGVLFYCGLFLPERIAKIFIKNAEREKD